MTGISASISGGGEQTAGRRALRLRERVGSPNEIRYDFTRPRWFNGVSRGRYLLGLYGPGDRGSADDGRRRRYG